MVLPEEKKVLLTVSDWVTFLSSEKFGLAGMGMNVFAILVALVALIISVGSHGLLQSSISGIVVLAITFFMIKRTIPIWQSTNRAEKILKMVMVGQLTSEESIRNKWLELSAGKKH